MLTALKSYMETRLYKTCYESVVFDSQVFRRKMVTMENPTCIARLVQFKVVAVSMQPRFHHIQHLNEVTIVGQRCTVGRKCKMAEHVEVCASPSTERVHF